MPLTVGIAGARVAGRLSRLVGAGGGTTVPGKVLASIDPEAARPPRAAPAARLGARLGDERQDDDRGDGRADPVAAGAARAQLVRGESALRGDVEPPVREQPGAGAVRGRRGRAAGDRGARSAAGRLPWESVRDQLDRYGELEHVAERWRGVVRGSGQRGRARRRTGTIHRSAISRGSGPDRSCSGSTIRGMRVPELLHAADSKWCLRCGRPYDYSAAYVGHLGAYHCPACGHERPELDVVAREIELRGLDGVDFSLEAQGERRAVRLAVPGLYNVYNALGAASLALALGSTLDDVVAGLERFGAAFGRFERIAIGDKRLLVLLVEEPGRRERGGPHAGRRRGAEARCARTERRDRGRARRVVDLGRRLGAAPGRARAGRRDR